MSICGEGGIRTLGTRKGTLAFQASPIDHSGTSPKHASANIDLFYPLFKASFVLRAVLSTLRIIQPLNPERLCNFVFIDNGTRKHAAKVWPQHQPFGAKTTKSV